ncbi:carbohydrate ABC transporter permease [Arthrobacter sp. MDT2-16]
MPTTLVDPPTTGTKATRRRSAQRSPRGLTVLLLAPALAIFVLFVIVPVLQAVRYSFYDWNGLEQLTNFIGVDNYVRLLKDPGFLKALLNNGLFVLAALFIQLPFALMIATLLTGRVRGRLFYRLAFFVPYVIAEVVAAVLWKLMMAPEGLINHTLEASGLSSATQLWLADPNIVMISLIWVLTWKYFGFYTLLLLAGLQAVPVERIEAAMIDGANKWQVFWNITLPGIAPTVRIAGFLAMVSAIQVFDLVWVMTKGGPVGASSTVVSYMVVGGLQNYQYGYASAVAVTISVIAFATAMAYQRLILSRDNEADPKGGKR